MSGFSARWLALREPHDRAARNRPLLDRLAALFAGSGGIAVCDLGCGTGATMRAICGLLPVRQRWRLVDNDQTLLASAAASAPPGANVIPVAADLAWELDHAIGEEADLVTMSALLDLVSAAWLDRLAAAMTRLQRPLYAALSYDGEIAMSPGARHDPTIIAAVNRHQLTDKGFGPALGPDAARIAAQRFRAAGFAVVEGRSDWHLATTDRDVQLEMIAGCAAAAGETGIAPALITQWLGERRDHATCGRSSMRVGHVDLLACPIGAR